MPTPGVFAPFLRGGIHDGIVMDPYRSATAPRLRSIRDLWLLAIVWIFAALRVGFGLYRGDTFGIDLTLAAMAVVLIPALLRE